jgi:nitrate/nitrite transport system substrate-binding protein
MTALPSRALAMPIGKELARRPASSFERCAMPIDSDPYDADRPLRLSCGCGRDHSAAEHAAEDAEAAVQASAASAARELRERSRAPDVERESRAFVEAALIKALFPHDAVRRRFIRAVGRSVAMAAIGSVLPIASLQAMAQDKGALEKKDLKIGFIPITCATPLIMAHPLGFYQQQGLNVEVTKTAGWALIRDKMMNREYDATHFLSPMPLAISLGLGSNAMPMNVATIQNVNGQAITLAMKHRNNRDPKNWKGFKFAIPFEFSMHNFLLRYYLAEAGLNPDTDVQLRVVPPAEMVANLRAGNIDGFLGPDPFNQRAVYEEAGFIHVLTRDLWNGHPCCAFGTSTEFIQKNPNSFIALYRAVLTAAAMAREAKNRELIAKVIAPAQYLNQPEAVLQQVLTGKFADGLGKVQTVPDRADFDPMPWQSMAVWMLTQMQRWGYLKGEVNYKQIAERVFLLTDAKKQMAALDQKVPDGGAYPKFKVMGKEFDADKAAAYAKSFAISKV